MSFWDITKNHLKDILPNISWDIIKTLLLAVFTNIGFVITSIVAVLVMFVSYWQGSSDVFRAVVITSIFWLTFFPTIAIAKLLIKLWKAKKLLNPTNINDTLTILELNFPDNRKGITLPIIPQSNQGDKENSLGLDYLISCLLDIDSFLFHEVSKKVKLITKNKHKIIPTKYLFAHADSYAFYDKLREDASYTIKHAESFFIKNSDKLANHLVDLVKNERKLTIVSLGIGFGRKEQALIQMLVNKQIKLSVLAIDINLAFIYSAFRHLREYIDEKDIDYKSLLGDFDRLDEYNLSLPKDRPVLFLALGGVFGNQNESKLLSNLKKVYQGEKYLLIDFQTKESLEEVHKGGYDSPANKRFIQNIIKVFCNEDVTRENIKACYYKDLRDLHPNNISPSNVNGAETIVMVGKTSSGQKRYVGYSTRYEKELLKKFFEEKECEFIEMFSGPEDPHTSLLLYKL